MVGSDQIPTLVITSEPLVEVAVRQFRERAREGFSLQFRSQVWCSSGAGEEASKRQNLQPWNEAPLNFVPLRSSFHYVGWGGLSRVEMNAKKRAPLTPLPTQKEKCASFHA